MGPMNIPAKFEIRSFTRSWDNRGYSKNLGRAWIRPRSLFSQMFKRLLFACSMYAVNISAKFELRSLTRSWDNRGYCKNLGSPWVCPCTLFSQIFNGILFAWTLWIYLSNLKFIALRVPEIIRGIGKNSAVPGYAHAPFSRKFLTGFCSHEPCEYTCQIWSL